MKKVLIITYYWPPAGGISVQRCLKFAKYLLKSGWEPIIYAPSNAQYPIIDYNNEKDIPQNIKIIKRPVVEPFNFFNRLTGRAKNNPGNPVYARDKKVKILDSIAIWIRGNFFIPDARCMWIKPSVKFLGKFLLNNPVDALLTDGPPHTNTVIACKLSKKYTIPWLADFQDPWTQVDYYKMFKISKWADKKHKKLEQEVFKTAAKITIASSSWGRDLESIGAKNVDTVYWGYDEDDFGTVSQKIDSRFSISHAGVLGFDRCPETFFKVLSDLVKEEENFSFNLQINLAGMVDYSVNKEMEINDLSKYVNNMGIVTRDKAIQLCLNSQLLLLPINKADNARGRIPGKLFEMMRSGRPILALGLKGSDVENLIRTTQTGEYFEYDDYIGIKSYIKKKYQEYLKNKRIENNDISTIKEYSVENQAKKIANYLNEISHVV